MPKSFLSLKKHRTIKRKGKDVYPLLQKEKCWKTVLFWGLGSSNAPQKTQQPSTYVNRIIKNPSPKLCWEHKSKSISGKHQWRMKLEMKLPQEIIELPSQKCRLPEYCTCLCMVFSMLRRSFPEPQNSRAASCPSEVSYRMQFWLPNYIQLGVMQNPTLLYTSY
jgi:hypothetical protein